MFVINSTVILRSPRRTLSESEGEAIAIFFADTPPFHHLVRDIPLFQRLDHLAGTSLRKRLIERLRAARVGLTGNQETTRGVLLEDCRDFIQRLLGVGRNFVTIVYHLVHPHFVSGFTGRPFREHHAQLVTARKSCDINNEKQERFPKIYQNLCSRK